MKAVGQLGDARMRGVLWMGVLGALVVFALAWAAVWWFVSQFDPSGIWGVSWLLEWGGAYVDWLVDIAFVGAMLTGTFLLFPAVVTVVTGLFLDRVAAAVEARHYPGLGAPRGQTFAEILATTVRFAVVVVALNILVLPVYLLLLIIPGANLVLYYLLNGYLVGREFFELVAFRRLEPGAATGLRRANRSRVLLAGVMLTFLMTIPVVNLLVPVVGAAFMVHVAQELMERRGIAGGGNASAPA